MITDMVFSSDALKWMDEHCGILPDVLMENAAGAVYRRIKELNRSGKILIVTGKGNNGGDGWCLAVMMQKDGLDVTVLEAEPPRAELTVRYSGVYRSLGGKVIKEFTEAGSCDMIVDCIFGFSFRGKVRESYIPLIEAVNSSGSFILSVDVPSGIDCDNEIDFGIHVKPDVTCTFTAPKRALLMPPAAGQCGRVYIEDIGTPSDTIEEAEGLFSLKKKRGTEHFIPYRAVVYCLNEQSLSLRSRSCD